MKKKKNKAFDKNDSDVLPILGLSRKKQKVCIIFYIINLTLVLSNNSV